MPHSFQQIRSPSPEISEGKQPMYEEELDEFGRVKQRRSYFGADDNDDDERQLQEQLQQRSIHSDRRRHENDSDADDKNHSGEESDANERRSSSSRQRRQDHQDRRRYHPSRSPSPSTSRYSEDNNSDDYHHHRHRHRHRHSRRRYSSDAGDDRSSSIDSRDSEDRYRHRSYYRRRSSSASPKHHEHRRHRRSSEMDDRLRKKIYIGDLVGVSSSELEQVFSKFGRITHVKLIEGKEYGFITFEEVASAQEAISMMNGAVVGSHKIKVNRAKMMDRSRHGNLTWMDEDGTRSHESGTSYSKKPPLDSLDPPIQRTLTSYDDLL